MRPLVCAIFQSEVPQDEKSENGNCAKKIFSMSRLNLDGFKLMIRLLKDLNTHQNRPLIHIFLGWGLWSGRPSKAPKSGARHSSPLFKVQLTWLGWEISKLEMPEKDLNTLQNRPLIHILLGWGLWSVLSSKATKSGAQHFSGCLGGS